MRSIRPAQDYSRPSSTLKCWVSISLTLPMDIGLEEWDFTTNTQRSLAMDKMPAPEILWQRLCDYRALEAQRPGHPLLYPYWRDPTGQKRVRYYQEVAVNRVIEQILRGEKRILINLATGTGKTFIAFQVVWKLIRSGHFANKRVLFLADRVVLRSQGVQCLRAVQGGRGRPRAEIEAGEIPRGRQIYFGIYQGLYVLGSDGLRTFEQVPTDYFDLIIIDECHRSGFGTWNEILQRFPEAVQLGMTATPKRTDNIDTYAYFGEPVFTYSLGQGIDDGFLANYKIHTVTTNFDADGLDLQRAIHEGQTSLSRRTWSRATCMVRPTLNGRCPCPTASSAIAGTYRPCCVSTAGWKRRWSSASARTTPSRSAIG